ncbi:serine hydrolase domain-containing protein [Nocardia rhizosphaerihabitans]|uniref:serine hydrolase domain-containing protein n=1 Tax=Nocardia rhizosphaerihabitans TaxID=1691570 RepID=UPI00366BEBAC
MNRPPSDGTFLINRRSALGLGAAVLAAGALAACGTDKQSASSSSLTTSATNDEAFDTSVLDTTAERQVATFRNFDRLFPTRVFRADPAKTTPLSQSKKKLDGLRYNFNNAQRNIDNYVADNRIAGLLVLKDGAIAHEQYAMGNTESSKWTSWSMAKSFVATLVGAALADKSIASLDDPVTRYVPELKDSPYQENTIRQVLQMCSGLRWTSKPYTLYGDSDIAHLFQAAYTSRPGAVMDVIRNRPRVSAPGVKFNYANADTYVLGAVVAKATGKNLSDYLSEKIWRRIGAEADGYWMLDSPNGLEMGGNNLSATLRDYGRFGQFILTGGEEVLPKGWRDEAGSPQSPTTQYGKLYEEPYPMGYGYQWWALPPGVGGARGPAPTFTAQGIHGQFLYINPSENVVVVQWAAWRESWESPKELEFLALLDGVVNALH